MTQGELRPTPEKQIHQEISLGQEGYSSHFRGESDWVVSIGQDLVTKQQEQNSTLHYFC